MAVCLLNYTQVLLKGIMVEDLLTFSRRGPLSYRNQSIDLQNKSMDWFLYDNGPRLERVNNILSIVP